MFLNRLRDLVSSGAKLALITVRRLDRDRARSDRTSAKRTLRNPITRVIAGRIVRLYEITMVNARRTLTRRVREALFPALVIHVRYFLRKRVAGNLKGDRRRHVLANFAAKRGVFRGLPLLLFVPIPRPRNQR